MSPHLHVLTRILSCAIWHPKIPYGSSERPNLYSSFPVPALPYTSWQLPNQLPMHVWILKERNWGAGHYPQVCGSCVSQEVVREKTHSNAVVSDEDCRTQYFFQFNFLRTCGYICQLVCRTCVFVAQMKASCCLSGNSLFLPGRLVKGQAGISDWCNSNSHKKGFWAETPWNRFDCKVFFFSRWLQTKD